MPILGVQPQNSLIMTEAKGTNREKARFDSSVRGNTLRVYLHVLRHGKSELRDIQRGLGLSTASLASYHLTKLMRAGYVGQDESGRYVALKDASREILEGYTRMGAAVVPQLFFFALLFSFLVGYFSLEALRSASYVAYLAIISMASVALLWVETVRFWRKLVTWT